MDFSFSTVQLGFVKCSMTFCILKTSIFPRGKKIGMGKILGRAIKKRKKMVETIYEIGFKVFMARNVYTGCLYVAILTTSRRVIK